ncbi:unnamed protein product [Cochlearia groenlandica]
MAETKSLERLKAMRSLLKREMEKSKTFTLVLNKTGTKLEDINTKLLSLEADVKVERWRSLPFTDHINHTIAPISSVLRVFSLVQELERSLSMSSYDVLGYVSDVKRLEEAMRLLSNTCVLALTWLQDTIEFLSENGMPKDHPCALRFTASLELLRELRMAEDRAYLKGGSLCTALENLETEFALILEEEVMQESSLRMLQAIIKRLDSHAGLANFESIYIKVRVKIIKKRFEIGYVEKKITEVDNVHEIEDDIDQWRLDMEVAVKEIYEFESNLCYEVFKDVEEEEAPSRCFGAIATKSRIIPLLRFGSRISKCKKDPPKLLKLLECFSTMESLRIEFNRLFRGEQCLEIRSVTRELIRNLVNGVCEIFWELPCQVELQRPYCPPLDKGVPKLVSVVTEYCNKLLGSNNKPILSKILEISLGWKKEKYQEELLTGHIYNILREIALNLDAWSSTNQETTLSCIFMMNNHCHFYALRDTHLGVMMGDSWLNAHAKYRDYYAALYVKESLEKILSLLSNKPQNITSSSSIAKRRRAREAIQVTLQDFGKGFDEVYEKQSNWVVEDAKLRWKICQAMVRMVVPKYKSYLQSYIMLLVEEEDYESDDGKDLRYTPKGLEKKLMTMFKTREEIEKSYKYSSHFVNKVMDLGFSEKYHMTLEAI